MTFEYDENNRISGFTLSISVPPYSSDNDYGRLYLFPDNKTNDKVHELRYDRNRYKLLAKFCKFKNECTLLLDLTNTFIK
ncbi:Uncharacterized protein BM_BM17743 [Brugia malayi]|uniref:Uncharacterized protein n=1 Tax=Brugia malayi TaxID=6279 RepID=A0A4E9FN30_BRUMA|nr:Uncharacterized protein BM_BM17743 [Brugia malayi]VIO97956.1 Uncharacterized protein BM_BM17743 [Brugia malayi]